jgi:pyrroline-5-carboxylate reductase
MTQSGLLSPDEVLFFEPRLDRREVLQEKYRVIPAVSNPNLVSRCPIVIMAVKPQSLPQILPEIGPFVKPDHLLISICAGVPLDYIQSFFPIPIPMVRAMPNTPALIQKGATALASSSIAQPEDVSTAETIFQAVGITAVVQESLMDAVTGLSGSGPAYAFAVIEALAAGGVKEGLSHEAALTLATQTLLGAAHLIQATGKHPATLRDQVCTPGGTTVAGLYALEEGGFRLALMNAVIAATRRSKELGEILKKPAVPGKPEKTVKNSTLKKKVKEARKPR